MPAALAYIICILIWGSTWFAIKFQLGAVPESVSLTYRFSLAALILAAYILFRRQKMLYPRSVHVWFMALGAAHGCALSGAVRNRASRTLFIPPPVQ